MDNSADCAKTCYLMSGEVSWATVFWSNGKEVKEYSIFRDKNNNIVVHNRNVFGMTYSVQLCGGGVLNPGFVASFFSRIFPTARCYVCPLTGKGLAAMQSISGRPCRFRMEYPCLKPPGSDNGIYQKAGGYYEKMEFDAYGKMAYWLAKGMTVYNGILAGPTAGKFHGAALSASQRGNGHWFMSQKSIDYYFPHTSLPIRRYAALDVPVAMVNTEQFEKDTGCSDPRVNVMISSPYLYGSEDLMGFYWVLSGGKPNVLFVSDTKPEDCDFYFCKDAAYQFVKGEQ